MPLRILKSAKEIFDVLGGVPAVAAMTGSKYNAAHNWLALGDFPPNTYVVMSDALLAKKCWASPALWRMVGVNKETERRLLKRVA